jgi:hypothetical protein
VVLPLPAASVISDSVNPVFLVLALIFTLPHIFFVVKKNFTFVLYVVGHMVPNGFGHITRDGFKTFCIVPYLVQCCVIFFTKNSVALITGVSLLGASSNFVF